MEFTKAIIDLFKETFFDSIKVSQRVFKVVIPITIIVKILSELGLIKYLAAPLEPLMALIGLPAEFGLAFAVSLVVNLYSAIVVVMGITSEIGTITVAQASIFSLVVLFAHNLILESKITQECGVSFISQVVLRFVVGMLAGIIMNLFYQYTGFHSEPARILLESPSSASLPLWVWGEILNLMKIFLIIWLVLLLHSFLTKIHVTDLLEKALSPFLKILGMTKETTTILIVGFIAGIVSGSGLLLKNVQEQKLSKKDLFCSISVMGLAHALIEDTILLMLLGASAWVTLGVRFVFTVIVGIIISLLYDLLTKNKLIQE